MTANPVALVASATPTAPRRIGQVVTLRWTGRGGGVPCHLDGALAVVLARPRGRRGRLWVQTESGPRRVAVANVEG